MCNEIKGLYDEIIITIVPNHTEKIIIRLLPLALLLMLHTRNNTDGNKLVIFSDIYSFGDTCITLLILIFAKVFSHKSFPLYGIT